MIDRNNLLELAVAFDLGAQRLGETTTHVMLVRVGDKWQLRATVGPMNVWGLDDDGVWKYKGWHSFSTRNEAIEAFNRSLDNPKWANGGVPPPKKKDEW